MNPHDFKKQLATSHDDTSHKLALSHLQRLFPSALAITKAATDNDRCGADYWLEFPHGRFQAVDIKARNEDWAPKGKPDIALEIYSVMEKKILGWTLDQSKLTDWVLFIWKDTGRAALFSFRMLQAVTQKNLWKWKQQYEYHTQKTVNGSNCYSSQVLFVDSKTIYREIYRHEAEQTHPLQPQKAKP